jgi:thiamine biosynthesis lipoprotein
VTAVAFAGEALGTTVRVVVTRPDSLPAVAAATRSALGLLDSAASRFRTDSELSRANASAGVPLRVGPVLRDAVQTCLRMAQATGGLVDPTVGAAVVAAGYDRPFSDIDLRQPRGLCPADETKHGWRDVVLVPGDRGAWLTVPSGMRLDLGAVAKSWLADALADVANSLGAGGALVDLGGDLAVSGQPPQGGWVIGLPAAGAEQQMVTIHAGGMATSGQDVRRWATGNGPAHHIIDPRTGRPADSPWRSVTVHAPTAVEANAASTAALVLGVDAPDWLEERGLSGRLVPMDAAPARIVASWPRATRTGVSDG